MRTLSFSSVSEYNLPDEPFYSGEVSRLYKAQDTKLFRDVAVKEVDMQHMTEDSFKAEITAMCRFNDWSTRTPCIIETYRDKRERKGYIVMQWIRGMTMREKIVARRDLHKAVKWIIDLCAILEEPHKNRYQHRDIKPENIQITPVDEVYLLDFNISLKRPDRWSGTLAYAAPEMQRNYSVTGNDRVDVFSIGVVLYELLTGERPVHDEHYYAESAHSKEWYEFKQPKDINSKITESLNEIIGKCMKLNPRDRYPNASVLKVELERAKRNTFWK